MEIYPLKLNKDHMFIELENGPWLIDTGAPNSFSSETAVQIENVYSEIKYSDYMGMTVDQLEKYSGVGMVGLLGGDVLNKFDFIFDLPHENVTISSDQIDYDGISMKLDTFMEIPIIFTKINGIEFKMFLDTGAQISYLQDEIIESFPKSDPVTDFFPGFGNFDTNTHLAEIDLNDIQFSLRFGKLPALLGATLMMGGVEGILGNDIFRNREIGYSPNRNLLYI